MATATRAEKMKSLYLLLLCFALTGCTPSTTGNIDNNSGTNINLDVYKDGKILIWSIFLEPDGGIGVQENHSEISLIIQTLPNGTSCQIDKASFQRGLQWQYNIYGQRFWRYELKGCKGDGGVLIKR
jgi:hypothetical protein